MRGTSFKIHVFTERLRKMCKCLVQTLNNARRSQLAERLTRRVCCKKRKKTRYRLSFDLRVSFLLVSCKITSTREQKNYLA